MCIGLKKKVLVLKVKITANYKITYRVIQKRMLLQNIGYVFFPCHYNSSNCKYSVGYAGKSKPNDYIVVIYSLNVFQLKNIKTTTKICKHTKNKTEPQTLTAHLIDYR